MLLDTKHKPLNVVLQYGKGSAAPSHNRTTAGVVVVVVLVVGAAVAGVVVVVVLVVGAAVAGVSVDDDGVDDEVLGDVVRTVPDDEATCALVRTWAVVDPAVTDVPAATGVPVRGVADTCLIDSAGGCNEHALHITGQNSLTVLPIKRSPQSVSLNSLHCSGSRAQRSAGGCGPQERLHSFGHVVEICSEAQSFASNNLQPSASTNCGQDSHITGQNF